MSAEQVTLVADLTPDVKAAADLRTHQYHFVQLHNRGVLVADAGSAAAAVYVLGNKPNSGEVCALVIPPNVAKVQAGEAINRGTLVEPMSATGLARGSISIASAEVNVNAVTPLFLYTGVAFSISTASGEYVSVHLRR